VLVSFETMIGLDGSLCQLLIDKIRNGFGLGGEDIWGLFPTHWQCKGKTNEGIIFWMTGK
jgi:hypothetical protein